MDIVIKEKMILLDSSAGVVAARVPSLGITAYAHNREDAIQRCRDLAHEFCVKNMEEGHLEAMLSQSSANWHIERDIIDVANSLPGSVSKHTVEWHVAPEGAEMETRLVHR